MAQSSKVWNVGPVARIALVAGLALGGAAACEQVLTSPGGAPGANHTTGTGSVAGRVLSVDGAPIPGAQVTTPGGAGTVAGPGGEFVLGGLAATERLAVTVSAEGHAATTAIYKVVAGATLSREVRLMPRGPRVRITAGTGGVVSFAGGGRVTIPANAFAGVAPGESVDVQVTYYDPQSEAQLSAAPGDFSAVEADGSTSQLETAGMVDIEVTDAANQRLSLAPGQVVTINFPDRDGAASASWGLYEFDRNTGTWERRGDAPVDPDGTQRADVPSIDRPWNADQPLNTTCITVRVEDLGGSPRPNEQVTAQGVNWAGPAYGWTDAAGDATLQVKASAQATVSAGSASAVVSTPPASTACTPAATLAY